MPSRRMVSSGAGGSRTRSHQGLSLAALPVCVPRHVESALDGIWTRDLLRDRQASTPGCSTRACSRVHVQVAQVGVEPTASLVLSQGGLPVAYRAEWSRMESNHRCLGVDQESLPLDHGTVILKWSHRESHPNLQHAMLVSFCWTMTPNKNVQVPMFNIQ